MDTDMMMHITYVASSFALPRRASLDPRRRFKLHSFQSFLHRHARTQARYHSTLRSTALSLGSLGPTERRSSFLLSALGRNDDDDDNDDDNNDDNGNDDDGDTTPGRGSHLSSKVPAPLFDPRARFPVSLYPCIPVSLYPLAVSLFPCTPSPFPFLRRSGSHLALYKPETESLNKPESQ